MPFDKMLTSGYYINCNSDSELLSLFEAIRLLQAGHVVSPILVFLKGRIRSRDRLRTVLNSRSLFSKA